MVVCTHIPSIVTALHSIMNIDSVVEMNIHCTGMVMRSNDQTTVT